MMSLTVRSIAATSSSRRASRSDSASIRSTVSGVRSRWDRSATLSRSCAISRSIRSASRFSPVPARRTSCGPATRARADRSPPARRSAARASAVSGRTSERASWSATTTLSSSRNAPMPSRSSQARVRPWRSTALGTKERITAVPPVSPPTATSTSIPPGTDALNDPLFRSASWTPVDRAAGTPTCVPSGRKTVTGALLLALTSATASRRSLPRMAVSSGATDWAWTMALDVAWSAASVRRTSANGTRKLTSTSDVVATTRATSRRLICPGAIPLEATA